jgi:hypothetical protein
MSTNTINVVAYADFEKASNAAGDLAERIGNCSHAGASKATMVELLKAWQVARQEARNSLERALANGRATLSFDSRRVA